MSIEERIEVALKQRRFTPTMPLGIRADGSSYWPHNGRFGADEVILQPDEAWTAADVLAALARQT